MDAKTIHAYLRGLGHDYVEQVLNYNIIMQCIVFFAELAGWPVCVDMHVHYCLGGIQSVYKSYRIVREGIR